MKLHSNDKALLLAMVVMLIGAIAYGVNYGAPWSAVLIGGLLLPARSASPRARTAAAPA